ncbi:MAG: dihydrodipicolinate synthase family protein [Planctomycetaceae bacterium]|nr:dihydrodipicolinate synthase family protein [Planctomycetaceae bacterium]
MNTLPITPEILSSSVIAVPPLARNADYSLNRDENQTLIRHLEAGGVTTLLYGGNAILYHVALSEYAELLGLLSDAADDDTLMIPSVGPAYGTMIDQAAVLRDFDFPTAMILPQRDVCTAAGIATGVRKFVDAYGRPAVLYIKHDGFIDVGSVKRLMDDGLLSWIKYAIVRDDTSDDPYLKELVDTIGPDRVVSGIGEQPARAHLQEFGLCGFTSGCVCIAPGQSMQMLRSLKSGDTETADRIRRTFQPLEDLRNSINPVRILHAAVTLAGIAEMGPVLPLLSEIDASDRDRVQRAARELLAQEAPHDESVHA